MPKGQVAEKSNGVDAAMAIGLPIPDESKDYQFDNPEREIEIPWGEDAAVVVVLEKPTDSDYQEHERNVIRKTLVVDGAQMDDSDPHGANAEFYDRLALRGYAKRKGEKVREFTRDEVLAFNFETKSAVIAGMSQSTFDVVQDDEFAGLFEDQSGDLVVRQKIGDPEDPSYTIEYTMSPLKKSERLDFLAAVQIKRKVKPRRTEVHTELHLLKRGKKLFAPHFRSLTGGRIEAGGFREDLRQDFLAQIDPVFQMLVIDSMVAAYGKGQD